MSARIGQNFSYDARDFLDYRQGYPKTKDELKNWKIPVPEGFEVCLSNVWYYYDSGTDLPDTGHWIPRVATSLEENSVESSAASLGLLRGVIKESDEKYSEILGKIEELEGTLFPATFSSLVIGSYYTQENKERIVIDQDEVSNGIVSRLSNPDLDYDKKLDYNDDNVISSADLNLANSSFQSAKDSIQYNTSGTGPIYTLEVGSYVIPKITWTLKRKGKTIESFSNAEVTGGSGGWVENGYRYFHGRDAVTSNLPRSFNYMVSVFVTNSVYAESMVSLKFLYKCYYGSAPESFLKSRYTATTDFASFTSFFTESYEFPKNNFDCTGGKYPYIFIPQQYYSGALKIYVNGMYNSDFNVYDCTVINSRGVQIPYKVLRTGIIQTGNPIPIQIV